MLRKRILTAIVAVPLLVLAVWFGAPWFTGLVVAAVVLGLLEFYGMAGLGATRPLSVFGIVLGVLFVVDARLGSPWTPALVTSVAFFSLVVLLVSGRGAGVAQAWAWTVAGVFYIGWMLSHAVLLRQEEDGRDWVLMAVLTTFAVDTGAYFMGRAWGKYKLAPSISPKKTWEGAIGGFLVGLLAAILLAAILRLEVETWQIVLLGGLIGVFSQLGDLAESLLKRGAGVKDAGSVVPGHGGVLDRLDSLIFSVVVVYYFVIWVLR